jgi:hypothetical protein
MDLADSLRESFFDCSEMLGVFGYRQLTYSLAAEVRITNLDAGIEILEDKLKPRALNGSEGKLGINDPIDAQALKVVAIEPRDQSICGSLI